MLLKEVHHRVKNNLQIISSLLSMQARSAAGQPLREVLQESQNRVKSMALVHERLYRSQDLSHSDLAGYVRDLVSYLFRSYVSGAPVITYRVDVEDIWLAVDTAVPCGLIINELVSNALKHAFPADRTGEVAIALAVREGGLALTIADNGVGFPADLDFRRTESLGLQLVNTLVEQLDGTVELNRTGGTRFRVTLEMPCSGTHSS
jgi:two-component sensor histidine kinase